jgi:hypothetical protein
MNDAGPAANLLFAPDVPLFYMIWIAPSEKDTAATTLEKQLWDSADQFRG